jgi:hypothetical protein
VTLADCLSRLPAADVRLYAVTAGVSVNAKPPAIAAALADPARLTAELRSLPPAGRDALTLLVVGFGGQVDRNALVRELSRMHPAAAGEAVSGLERRGFLVPRGLTPWSATLVDDVVPAVRQAVSAWLVEAANPWVAEARETFSPDPNPAVADTARLLGAMADGVRVKQQGGVFRADQRRLAQLFDRARPTLPAPLASPWTGYASEVLALHLALAIQLQLVVADPRGWWPAPEAEAWVDLPPGCQWASLVRAWRDIGTARLQGRFADLLGPFLGGAWVDLDRWRAHLARYVRTYPPLPAAAEALLLRPGLLLGAMAVGRAGERTVFRLTEAAVTALAGGVPAWPEVPERTVVDADFEVTVPPGAPARVTWDLERWAHRVAVDRVARYRITREGVQRRSRTGEPAAAWLERLAAAARFGVPDNVRFAVGEWAVPAQRAVARAVVAVSFPEGTPEGWSPPPGAQAAGPGCWLLDLPAAGREVGILRRRGVVVEGAPEEWTAMERARNELRRRAGAVALDLPWPGPHDGDPPTPLLPEAPTGG